MKLKTITYKDIMSFGPCYDPAERGYCTRNWKGNALDILKKTEISEQDRLWLVLREKVIDKKTLRKFAVWRAREALKLVENPDPRSIEACNVAERYANGRATEQELDAARSAAWSAAWSADWSAADAAWSAAWSAARSAADAAWSAADAARFAQIEHLIWMLEK